MIYKEESSALKLKVTNKMEKGENQAVIGDIVPAQMRKTEIKRGVTMKN